MSLKLHPVRIAKKVKLNKDAAVYFDIPANLKDVFKYNWDSFSLFRLI